MDNLLASATKDTSLWLNQSAPRTDLFTGLRCESNPLLGLKRYSIVSDRMANMLVHVMDNPLAGQQSGNVEITLPKFHYLNK